MQFSGGQDVRLNSYSARTSLSRVFKHGLPEGSTFLFQYSSITRTPLESSQLGELKYAISAGQDVRLKNKSLRKCKNDIAQRAYMVTLLWTGSNRFGQVRTGVKYYFSSTVSHTISKFGLPPKPACSFLTVPHSKLYDPPKWWKQCFATLQLA